MPSLLRKSQRLSYRVTAAIWTVCAAVLMVSGLFFYGFENQQRQTQVDQAKVLLHTVYQQKSEEMANEIFANHREALRQTLADIQKVKGIAAIQILDRNGQLFESAGSNQFGYLLKGGHEKVPADFSIKELVLNERPGLLYATPIKVIGEQLGYFCAFFDLSEMHSASRKRIILIVAVFGSLLLVLSMVVHRLLTKAVITPVSQIRDAMEQVMQGKKGDQVSMAVKNEIGEVADAFNAMSSQLQEQHERLTTSMKSRDSYAQQLEETNRKLARLNADLESIVEERTRELRNSYEKLQNEIQERIRSDRERRSLQERLARSKKMEALGLLAGGVAHDLNNVLSGIVSYPELILMDLPMEDPMKPMIETMQRSGQKAAAIVQDLLALARRGVTHMVVLNLNKDVISDYLASPEFRKLKSYYPEVAVETNLAKDLMNIQGSTIHLRKAVMNLVSNAAEAQPEGGCIRISTRNRYVDKPISGYEEVNEGDYVVLRVEDDGSGIETEDLDRIFEPFYTKKKMGRSGTGLGMAVVWGTVQDHEGYINVVSHVGKGTCFELYFPVTREKSEQPSKSVTLDNYMGRGETVLVVDDVPEQRKIATTLLKRLNYEVFTVSSGEDAIEFIKENKVDILVLDMIMDPGMDGLDTFRAIRSRLPHQKAIIASGFAENQRVMEAQRLGAGCYIRKPYTIDKIAMALRNELEQTDGAPRTIY